VNDHGLLGEDLERERSDEPAVRDQSAELLARDSWDSGDAIDFADEPAPTIARTVGLGEHGSHFDDGPAFDDLDSWVNDYLLVLYRRSTDGSAVTWCPEWWRHPEAYLRLDALWRAWEYLRRQPATGMAVWIRDYVDPHMAVLLSEGSGPFKGCSEKNGHAEYPLRPLETRAIPSPQQIAQLLDQLNVQDLQSVRWSGEDA
jgi:hypothetical protein